MRTSSTAAARAHSPARHPRSSVATTALLVPGRDGDTRHHDDLVAAHDERPRLALRPGDLRIDEEILHLLAAPGEPVPGSPPAHAQTRSCAARCARRPSGPAGRARRRPLEPDVGRTPGRPRDRRRGRRASSLPVRRAGRRSLARRAAEAAPASSSAARRFRSAAGWSRRSSGQDLVADQAALRVRVRGVDAELGGPRPGSTPRSRRARP